jgi:hypothetical protein
MGAIARHEARSSTDFQVNCPPLGTPAAFAIHRRIPPAARKINTVTSKSERLRADDRDALLFAFAVLIKHGRISVADRLGVLAADDQDID